MPAKTGQILAILDKCCDAFTFPMLDNGYVYLAATRLSLFRSPEDWAMVIEVFGYSPRLGLPDIHVYTFGSRLHDRQGPDDYVNQAAYEKYLATNPNNESRFFHPIDEGDWLDEEDSLFVAENAKTIVVRGKAVALPSTEEYAREEIELEEAPRVTVFELCRWLAATRRDDVLATADERRVSVLPEMKQILQLEEWNHPNVVNDKSRPSRSITFQELAKVLETGDPSVYRASETPNTDWINWPEGGTL